MNKEENQYLSIVKNIIETGESKKNRTKYNSRTLFGQQMRFNLLDSKIPLITTKKVYTEGIIHELLWFISGSTNIKYLKENKVNIWNLDEERFKNKIKKEISEKEMEITELYNLIKLKEENPERSISYFENLENLKCKYYNLSNDIEWREDIRPGELGPIYGYQWRNYNGQRIDQIFNLIDGLKNDGESRRHIVCSWNPAQIEKMALPPCFIKGSYVRTENGYKEISTLSINDKVFDDKDDLQNINNIYKTKYNGDVLKIKLWYNCQEIFCTENHPFLTKNKKYTDAKNLKKGDFLCFKKNKSKQVVPKFIFEYSNQYKKWTNEYMPSKKDMFVFGYFVGDGWCCSGDYRCCFSINNKQKKEILPKIRELIKVSLKKNSREDLKNVETYETRNKNMFKVLEQFGNKAHNKKIPNWIFDLPIDFIESFVQGFKEADGNQKGEKLVFTTTSPSLAYGFSKLLSTINKKSSVRFQEKEKKTVICGREVNQKDLFYFEENFGEYTEDDDEYIYVPIFEIKKIKSSSLDIYDGYVYNLEVENSHTYTINNIINHNCHVLFQFGIEQNKYLTCALYQRSADFGLGVPFNIASYSILTHMIAQVTGLEAKEFIWFGFDCHVYENHIDPLLEQIKREPFEFPTISLNKDKKNIDNFKIEDFNILDYRCHPKIKMEMNT